MHSIGIDIGSTAAKVAVFSNKELVDTFVIPTGWSSLETSEKIRRNLEEKNIEINDSNVIATGYGRISVPYAFKTITEITCHGKGAFHLMGEDCTVIDIGGQDTKIISISDGKVSDFTMNDKCAAGTGKFLELMANTLGIDVNMLAEMALKGDDIEITSMCTVFAESEVISLIASGTERESIARGIINSITGRVYSLLYRHGSSEKVYLTGGLCEVQPFVDLLSKRIEKEVYTHPLARFAGAIGAALIVEERRGK